MSTKLPDSERFGIISQIKRSSVSVPANIVEAYGRFSIKEKIRFLYIANSSLEETKYFLILIEDLDYFPTPEMQEKLVEVSKLLNSYIKQLKEKV